MKNRSFNIIALVTIGLLMTVSAQAGTGKRIATAGATELLIPVGARATALGGANLANVYGIDAMYWNPAGVVGSPQRTEIMFSHLQWIGDINVNYVAAMASLGNYGAIGLNIKTMDFGDIVETNIENPDGTGSVFSPNYLTVGLNYSRMMTDRIHFGVNMKIVSEKIMGVSAAGLGFDFGLQYVNSAAGLKLGVVLANFGTDMKFSGSDLETRMQLPGTESGSTAASVSIPVASFDLPSQLKFGISYDLAVAKDNLVTLMGSFVNNSYAYDQYVLGAEYGFRNMFFLRGAYATAYREGLDESSDSFVSSNQDFVFGPSLGAGFKFNVGTNMIMNFDYAYRSAEFFSDTQWFSFTVGF